MMTQPSPRQTSCQRKEKEDSKSKTEYSFDVSKADQIFDYLLKDKQIRLLDGHKNPPLEELKSKKYCKWHNSYNHAMFNWVVFRKSIHKAIKERRFNLADKCVAEMTVNTDHIPIMGINMVYFLGAEKGKGKKYLWVLKQEVPLEKKQSIFDRMTYLRYWLQVDGTSQPGKKSKKFLKP